MCLLTVQRSIIRQRSFSPCTLSSRAHVLLAHTEHPTTTLSVNLYLRYGDQVYTINIDLADTAAFFAEITRIFGDLYEKNTAARELEKLK